MIRQLSIEPDALGAPERLTAGLCGFITSPAPRQLTVLDAYKAATQWTRALGYRLTRLGAAAPDFTTRQVECRKAPESRHWSRACPERVEQLFGAVPGCHPI